MTVNNGPQYKLGKKPASSHAPYKLNLTDFVSVKKILPQLPSGDFGHTGLLKRPLGVLANDRYSCCVFSGAAHETMIFNAEAGCDVGFTDDNVLADYSMTGFDPKTGANDDGADMLSAARYRRDTGIIDAQGNRHKIQLFLALEPGNFDHVKIATYICSCIGAGYEFPDSAMQQFGEGKPFDIVDGASIDGGHYMPLSGRRGGLLQTITWGVERPMTDRWFDRYCDEALAYFTEERIRNGVDIDGFARQDLIDYINSL